MAKIAAWFGGGQAGCEQDDERHGAVSECATDETDSQAARLRIPLRDGGATRRVDDACAATAQHGVAEHGQAESVGVGKRKGACGAQQRADKHRARRSYGGAMAQRRGQRGRPGLEHHPQGEDPEGRGRAPSARSLQRGGGDAVAVLEHANPRHGRPGKPEHPRPGTPHDVLRPLADPVGAAMEITDFGDCDSKLLLAMCASV